MRAATIFLVVLCGCCQLHSFQCDESSAGETDDHDAVEKPNIIVMFADNFGYADLSMYGAPVGRTPNIDRLSKEGLQFEHWNSAAHLCSASRAALLTGRYPVRTGVYPGVFEPDAEYGLPPEEITLAEYLKDGAGYATAIVGKWHLGHQPIYLPTRQGFDEWVGVPFHMSGGSLDDHTCVYDENQTWWLPLFEGESIVEQPVQLEHLATLYAERAREYIKRQIEAETPFFLYLPFSHVHQLCAPKDGSEQATCQWARHSDDDNSFTSTFGDAVHEMDWIAGQVLDVLEEIGAVDNTLVLFTSDNGPWLAEQSCAGSKGPWKGQWLADNTDPDCTACPHDFVHDPTPEHPRRCRIPQTGQVLEGVHCGEDVGLGSLWEANLRMPALARLPGKITPGTTTKASVSTLDILPTVLSMLGLPIPTNVDGVDISPVLFGQESNYDTTSRVLFFWRDGFVNGTLPQPYGRMDVAAVKLGHIKAWIWTKSAHYNPDVEVYHDPPLLFDVEADPAEAFPLDPNDYADTIAQIRRLLKEHKSNVDPHSPLALARDPKYRPCVDHATGCRTTPYTDTEIDAILAQS